MSTTVELGPGVTQESTVVRIGRATLADLGGGEAVVLDLDSGRYYGVNEVGVFIFELLTRPVTVAEVIAAVEQEFEVSDSQLLEDVLSFLQKLSAAGLVHVANDA